MKIRMERVLRRGHGMCRGPVLGVSTAKASLKEGPSDWRAGSKGDKPQNEAGEAVEMGPCRAF